MDRLSAGETDRLAQLIGSDQHCGATDALWSWQGERVSFLHSRRLLLLSSRRCCYNAE